MLTRRRLRAPYLHVPGLVLALSAASPALAQSEPEEQADLPAQVVVTGTRTGEGAASATTTVSAEQIARLQPPSLRDALDDVAGVRAFSTGGVGGGSFVSIRGGEPNFTMVLLDGVRINDSTNSKGGAFDFGLIDPALVEAVEVDRGASSAVHGSDALSGVINIRLREPVPGPTHASMRITSSTGGEFGGGASLSRGWDGGGLLIAGSAYESGDLDLNASLRRQQGLVRLNQRIGDFEAVALGTYTHGAHSIFPEDSGGPQFALNRDREKGSADLWSAALSLRHVPQGVVRPELSLSYSAQTSDVATPAIAPGVLDAVPAMTAHNRLTRLEAIGDVVVDLAPLLATVGAAYLDENGRSRGTIDFGFPLPADFRLDRRTVSGFAEATLQPLPGLTLNGAGRYDSVDGGPSEWTGRASIAYRPVAGGPSLFARWGEGFKLPSFYALGNPLVGNPDLRPERSRNIEAGVEWPLGHGQHVRIAWFDNHFRDLVDFDPETFRTVNRARVNASGAEAEAMLLPTRGLTLTGALTYVKLDSETPLRGRPRWQGSFGAAWQALPKLELGGRLRFNSSFYDSSVPTGLVITNGHAEVDANLRYAVSEALRLDLALRNIGDTRAWEAIGFPETGRTLRASLIAAF